MTSSLPSRDALPAQLLGSAPVPPRAADVEHAVTVLRLLAEPTRFSVVAVLAGVPEMTVGELATCLDRPVPALSQHLAKLRAQHVVVRRREGTEMWYSLGNLHVGELVRHVLHNTEHALYDDPPHHRGRA